MSAILEDVRRLEAAHAAGKLSAAELEAAKTALVEDASELTQDTPQEPAVPSTMLFDVVLFCAIAAAACVVIATFIFGDFTLALTLTVTLLAAFTIRAFLALDDD